MGFLDWALIITTVLLVGDLIVIAVWPFVVSKDSGPDASAMVSSLAVVAGVFVALITWLDRLVKERSSNYLEAATDMLGKAYDSLGAEGPGGAPKPSRLSWLTAARLVRTAEELAELITEGSHQRIWERRKEYWRGRLYDLINPEGKGFPSTYYAEKPEHMLAYTPDEDREPLAPRSLAVLYRFIDWPSDVIDPIKNEPYFSEDEIERMATFGPRGLGELLEQVEKIKADMRSKDNE